MGKITIRRPEDTEFVRTADSATAEAKARYGEGELSSSNRRILPTSDESLQLFEVRLEPDTDIQAHAHSAAEIILISAGSMILGKQECFPGTAIFIDDNTLYGFRSGPGGCQFYNFRPVPQAEYLTKAELMEQRSSVRAGAD